MIHSLLLPSSSPPLLSLLLISRWSRLGTAVVPPPLTHPPSVGSVFGLSFSLLLGVYIVLKSCSWSQPAGVTSDTPET